MHLMYIIDEKSGKRVYTLDKVKFGKVRFEVTPSGGRAAADLINAITGHQVCSPCPLLPR